MLEVLQPESRIKRFVGYTLALYMLFDIFIFVIRLFIELPEASLKKYPKKDTIAVIPINGYRN